MEQRTRTGLLFGSFNPVHTGHLIIASHFTQYTDMSEVWFVLSPRNPFKGEAEMLDQEERLYLLKLATEDNPAFKVCETELHMPTPSYTINTLKKLTREHPHREFGLLIGEDNLKDFDKWKDHQDILKMVGIYVYPRGEESFLPFLDHPGVQKITAPRIDISSSMIRKAFRQGKNPRYMLPDKVLSQIKVKGFYL